ncbi:trehalose-phosphatase, partial [Chloroflexota bacterium]
AILSPEARETLRDLAQKPAFSMGIISGRSLLEIKAMVEIEGIYYAGNHGLEIEGPGLKFTSPATEATRTIIKELVGRLSDKLNGVQGVIIEDKGLSLSVHYRLVKEAEENQVAEVFRQITTPLLGKGKIRVSSGKKVWEVRPPIDWHKGKAVATIMQEVKALLKLEQLLTIYLGDDTTDEDAFQILHRPQGWSIFVGPDNTPSKADYFLNSTSEVMTFLSRLLEFR